MGKPAPTLTWPLSGTYPGSGSAWSGTPIAVAPGFTFYTPNVKPPAENANYILGTQQAFSQASLDWAGNGPALNFCPAIINTALQATSSILAAKWDSLLRRWLVAVFDTSGGDTAKVWGNWGLDNTLWSGAPSTATGALGASGNTNLSVSHDGSTAGNVFLAVSTLLVGSQVNEIQHWNGSGWSNVHSPTASGSTQAQPECVTSGTTTVVAAYSTLSTTVNGGSSWTDQATVSNVNAWYLKVSPLGWLAIPANTSGTAYYSSPNGVTWTTQAFSIVATGDAVGGLTYGTDALGSAWFLAVNKASGAVFIYRSADGVTWTVVHSMSPTCFGSIAVQVSDLVGLGSILVATCTDASAGGPSIQILSINGGATWWQVPNGFLPANANSYSRPRIHASDVGMLVHNGEYLRFSQAAGVPTTLAF